MFKLTKREQIILIVALVLLVAYIGTFMLDYNKEEPIEVNLQSPEKEEFQENFDKDAERVEHPDQLEVKKIAVHVKGQVMNPGVVIVNEGARVIDAITLAGGEISDSADIHAINLAALLRDGQEVYVPAVGEEISPSVEQNIEQWEDIAGGSVNINTATLEELDSLPGIGPATAKKIIDFRNTHNGFKSVEDIINVSGIGEKKFAQIKELITVY